MSAARAFATVAILAGIGDRIAVYSVRLGDYDNLVEQPVAAESSADFIYLTDDSTLTSQTWKLQLIEPLEADGTLVKRSRGLLEREVGRFLVLEHDRIIVACAALYPFPEDSAGELACLVVRDDFRNQGAGERLLTEIERRARRQRLKRLFVLTTRAEHWFVERGFAEASPGALPRHKRALYNYQRRSVVLVKRLRGTP